MSNWSTGFADELEKLALRPPSPSEIAPTGFGFSGGGATPAPDPAAPPTQNVHVHVHHQAKKVAPAASAPAQTKTEPPSKSLDMPSTDAPGPIGLPSTPTFGGAAGKAAPKTYESAGRTPGPHSAPKGISIGKPAEKGTTLPSQMNTGPRWVEDTGNGPTRDAAMTPKDLLGGLAQANKPTQMAPGMSYVPPSSQGPDSSYSGLQYGKGPDPAKAAPKPWAQAGGVKPEIQPMAAPMAAPKPAKKKMFGTALASNDEPAKM